MYKPLTDDPKCCFSVSLPISMLRVIEDHLENKSRSEFIREALLYWFREKNWELQ